MLKTYRTSGALAMKIPMRGGGAKQINFDHGDGEFGVYVTNDETVQNALENFYLFGKIYELVKTEEERPVLNKSDDGMNVNTDSADNDSNVYDVVTLQEARNILIDEYGVNNSEIRGKAKTLAKAAELGVTFNGLD